MTAEFTDQELDIIAKKAFEKLQKSELENAIHKQLDATVKKYVDFLKDSYFSEGSVAQYLKPIVDNHVRQFVSDSEVYRKELRSYLNSEEFKKVELEQLRRRVNKLEDELYGKEDDE